VDSTPNTRAHKAHREECEENRQGGQKDTRSIQAARLR